MNILLYCVLRQLAFKYLYPDPQLNQGNYFPHYLSLFLSLSQIQTLLSLLFILFFIFFHGIRALSSYTSYSLPQTLLLYFSLPFQPSNFSVLARICLCPLDNRSTLLVLISLVLVPQLLNSNQAQKK